MKYFSQTKQDEYLDNLLNKKENGFFIEIGANDGIGYSNSYFFEKYRNWKGICIEPIPKVFQMLEKNRNCHCYCCAISDSNGIANFLHVDGEPEMLSGLEQNYNEKHYERAMRETEKYGGSIKRIEVKTRTLQSILDELQVTHVDFCSIDTEGAELAVVKSIDFDKVFIEILVIENNYEDSALEDYLKTKGYDKFCRIVVDDIFISTSSKHTNTFKYKIKKYLINSKRQFKQWVKRLLSYNTHLL